MEVLKNFINEYGANILYTIIIAIAGYIGTMLKNAYIKYINDKTKADVVRTCVKAVEQLYSDLKGKEKLDKCIQSATELLNEKGITISEIELNLLIESVVNEFKQKYSFEEYFSKEDKREI